MKAGDLKRGKQFRVAGWNEKIVLTVLIPLQRPLGQNIKLCVDQGGKVAMAGFAILAGRGEPVGVLLEDMYVLPIMTEVVEIA